MDFDYQTNPNVTNGTIERAHFCFANFDPSYENQPVLMLVDLTTPQILQKPLWAIDTDQDGTCLYCPSCTLKREM